jgi:hypothetical protein
MRIVSGATEIVGVGLADGISVYPGLKLPAGIQVPPGAELADAQAVLDLL